MTDLAADIATRVLAYASPAELERLQHEVLTRDAALAVVTEQRDIYRRVLERLLFAGGTFLLETLARRSRAYEPGSYEEMLALIMRDLIRLDSRDELGFADVRGDFPLEAEGVELYERALGWGLDVEMGSDEDAPMTDA